MLEFCHQRARKMIFKIRNDVVCHYQFKQQLDLTRQDDCCIQIFLAQNFKDELYKRIPNIFS